jgi:RNA polymerase sigma factor (sigma-70 family)
MKNLWEKLRQSDAEAMVLLYEQSYDDLLSYGGQVSNNIETAKDAINEIFLNLWDNRSNLKPVENVKAYLFACMRRIIFQSAIINRKVNTISETPLFNQQVDLSHEDILIAMHRSDEIRKKVQKAIEKLTDRQKELIRLKYFKDMDYRQIETKTGMSIQTIYNTMHNAMKVLAFELRDIHLIIVIIFLMNNASDSFITAVNNYCRIFLKFIALQFFASDPFY